MIINSKLEFRYAYAAEFAKDYFSSFEAGIADAIPSSKRRKIIIIIYAKI